MTEKIVVHVPNKHLSKAVQEYLREKKDSKPLNRSIDVPTDKFQEQTCLRIEDNYIHFDSKSYYEKCGYTIISVDEFFAREAEKEELFLEYQGIIVRVSVDDMNLIHLKEGSEHIVLTWPEYDRIGTLRPNYNIEKADFPEVTLPAGTHLATLSGKYRIQSDAPINIRETSHER